MKNFIQYLVWVLVFGCLLFTGGCLSLSDLPFFEKKVAVGFDEQARYEEEGDPKIRSGLVLRISVTASGATAVQETLVEVNLNGEILMPLVGAVKCDGLTIVMLQDKIKDAYKAYYIEPQVTVGFAYTENQSSGMKSPWGSVLVMGCVARPGPVNMPSTRDLRVTRALMLSGNVTPLADARNVRVTRREKDGSLKRFKVDIDLIGKEGRSDLDILLKPGDVIWVPESWY